MTFVVCFVYKGRSSCGDSSDSSCNLGFPGQVPPASHKNFDLSMQLQGNSLAPGEDCYLAVDVDELTDCQCAPSASDTSVLRVASKYVAESRLAGWVATQNRVARAAPSTCRVYIQHERQRAAIPAALRPPSWGAAFCASVRKKATLWRRRFGGRMSVLRPRPVVPLADMRDKAQQHNHGGTTLFFCKQFPRSIIHTAARQCTACRTFALAAAPAGRIARPGSKVRWPSGSSCRAPRPASPAGSWIGFFGWRGHLMCTTFSRTGSDFHTRS